ncbi:hypothetical protein DH2020_008716 [Rehmannia glutinosa]|uniref:Serine acetyltransferase N-terminal domain-containing protein n=1 Tax=Rehmannia glutinosa TaxID=99300 RepID=A0ABR0X487_REHGL
MATCVHSSGTKAPPQTNPSIGDHVFDNYVRFCRPNLPDTVSCAPISEKKSKPQIVNPNERAEDLWLRMKDEARSDVDQEPILSNYYFNSILCHDSMENALANYLSMKLSNSSLPSGTLYDLFLGVLTEDREIIFAVNDDLRAVKERDPACISYGIHGMVSEVFAVDIHPGAKIGRGILLDHATGLVIGETAVIGNNVSILHNVTLGGTGSVVLKQVPARTTAVGNPAKLIGGKENPIKLDKMPSLTMDHTSHISEWSDYVI